MRQTLKQWVESAQPGQEAKIVESTDGADVGDIVTILATRGGGLRCLVKFDAFEFWGDRFDGYMCEPLASAQSDLANLMAQKDHGEDTLRAITHVDRMLAHFCWGHLPPFLGNVSRRFGTLAIEICEEVSPGPERTVALRKLLESKDAAVRAAVNPGV